MSEIDLPDLPPRTRIYLCVADGTEESRTAIRFASLRARRTDGRVALLMVMPQEDYQGFLAIDSLIAQEAWEEAKLRLDRLGLEVKRWSGHLPCVYVREGKPRDALLDLLSGDKEVTIVMLGAPEDDDNPSPLIAALASKYFSQIKVPVTIVPGGLSDTEVDELL